MKVISTYSGGGGIDEGLKQAGIKTDIAIDWNYDACRTLKINHPETEVICGKVGDYVESLPKASILVGGPPCPEFSRANLGRTFDMCEINNFLRILEVCKPKYFLMENVQDSKKKLFKGSYLVNCADYGVPQTRVRRFFTNLPLPSPTHSENPQSNLFGKQLEKWITIGEALNIKGIIEDRKTTFGEKYGKEDGKFRQYSTERPSITIATDSRLFLVVEHQWLIDKNPTIYEKHRPQFLDQPATTVNTRDRASPNDYVTDGKYARKLENEELAVIQGFPKDYQFYGGKTSVRIQIGNAVPPPVIRAFFSQVKPFV